MSDIGRADAYLVEGIKRGDSDAWSQMVARYAGRLTAFAASRVGQRADAEDVVQETFIALLKGLDSFRGQSSLETYLFSIARRKIVDNFRGKSRARVCLLQDVRGGGQACDKGTDKPADAFADIAGCEPTGSWYVRRDEEHGLLGGALAAVIGELFDGLKDALRFTDMKVVELLFYCHLANREVATVTGVDVTRVAMVKHRWIKRIRDRLLEMRVGGCGDGAAFENLLTDVWEQHRLSCPKRSTIGAYILGTLEDDWRDYVAFHLETLGCHFCRANLRDLREQTATQSSRLLQKRILESTVGFLMRA